ncbi:killer cell lectin-like receptor subfamily B member 1C [Pseudopipra pipra]|uniref:killer cell lectin-like receptor subfamily B member 1C n=1 Tax=Pseudopipra pipra TaxID=415032 RepID=UPI0031397DBE
MEDQDGYMALEQWRKRGAAGSPPSSPGAEAEGCRLCPVGWMLGRTKCYWVSERMNSWHGSREDCGDRGAAMAMPWDKDELDSLNETLRKPTRHFWIGLSVPAPGVGWTWVNGSRPDWSR